MNTKIFYGLGDFHESSVLEGTLSDDQLELLTTLPYFGDIRNPRAAGLTSSPYSQRLMVFINQTTETREPATNAKIDVYAFYQIARQDFAWAYLHWANQILGEDIDRIEKRLRHHEPEMLMLDTLSLGGRVLVKLGERTPQAAVALTYAHAVRPVASALILLTEAGPLTSLKRIRGGNDLDSESETEWVRALLHLAYAGLEEAEPEYLTRVLDRMGNPRVGEVEAALGELQVLYDTAMRLLGEPV